MSKAAPFVPVVGSAYGFSKTCIQVYNATSPQGKLIAGDKGIIIDCTPPVVKYPLLCAAVAACAAGATVTGDPSFIVGAIECCSAIVLED